MAGVVVPRVGGGARLIGVGGMGLGFGYVSGESVVDWAGPLWMMQRVVKKLVVPMGRVL